MGLEGVEAVVVVVGATTLGVASRVPRFFGAIVY